MHIEFNSSPRSSLGVEMELGLVDAETRRLVSAASDLLGELGRGHPGGEHPKAKHELFESCVEIITGVCATPAEARDDLARTLDEVATAAAARNLDLVCAGTHPFSPWHEQQISPSPRYHQLVEDCRWTALRLVIFGVHFHVGVRSPEKSIAIANTLGTYLPHLLALSSSSPYLEGHDTGMASVRTKVFEALPTAGLPEQLAGWAEFEEFMATLQLAGAIRTVKEVWWDIRPHPDFGTVELRMCDGIASLEEVAAIASLAQSLVDWLDSLHDRGYTLPVPPQWVVRQNKWRAARYGLDAELIVDGSGGLVPVRQAVADTLEELTPVARRLGGEDELLGVRRILERGSSADRQRRVVEQGGTLVDVVDSLATDLGAHRASAAQS
ncbi:MAG TPA: glutamate--cysteine ligase [Acidimicrobiales bacterium]